MVKKYLIYAILATCLFCGCNLDYPPSTVSQSISESKEKKCFVFKYKVDSLNFLSKKDSFIVDDVWIEKTHTSSMNILGTERFKKNDSSFQVVFDINGNSYFSSDTFLRNWVLVGEKNEGIELDNHMINIFLSGKKAPQHIKFRVYKLRIPFQTKQDIDEVAEFVLNKQAG